MNRKGSGVKTFFLILLVLILAGAAAGYYWYLPTQYELATCKKELGRYEEAIEALKIPSLIHYKDTDQQIAECEKGIRYQEAERMFEAGRYEEAAKAFERLGDFLDSSERVAQAEASTQAGLYAAAMAQVEAGEYESALATFESLGDYEDAAEQITAVQTLIDQKAYDAAALLLADGKFEEAKEAFAALGDFSDAAGKVAEAQNAVDQKAYDAAALLLADGKFEETKEAFAALGEFSDAASKVAEAQYAIDQRAYDAAALLLADGKFEEAEQAFAALGKFNDSAEQAARAHAMIPGIDLSATEVSTRIGERKTVTASLRNLPDPEKLVIKGEEASSSIVQRGDSWYIVSGRTAAELVGKTIEDDVITLVFEGSVTSGSRKFTISAPQAEGSGEPGEVYGEITVNNEGISEDDAAQADSVHYIGDRGFFKYDDANAYVLNFSLKDTNEKNIASPAFVDIRIENDSGVTVYNEKRFIDRSNFGTWTSAFYGQRYMAGVYIQPEDITEGNTTSGTVYFTVNLPGYFDFGESQVSASDLPTYDATRDCKLDAPSISANSPVTLRYRSSSAVKITELKYEFIKRNDGNVDLKLSFSGEKTEDSQGANHSGTCYVGYKLYDPEGFVLKSGSIRTTSVAVGEKFRNVEETFRNIAPGAYKLILIDVD